MRINVWRFYLWFRCIPKSSSSSTSSSSDCVICGILLSRVSKPSISKKISSSALEFRCDTLSGVECLILVPYEKWKKKRKKSRIINNRTTNNQQLIWNDSKQTTLKSISDSDSSYIHITQVHIMIYLLNMKTLANTLLTIDSILHSTWFYFVYFYFL